jgi:hypothetical protein
MPILSKPQKVLFRHRPALKLVGITVADGQSFRVLRGYQYSKKKYSYPPFARNLYFAYRKLPEKAREMPGMAGLQVYSTGRGERRQGPEED